MDVTAGKIASWFFGVIFILAGLGALTQSVIGGLIYLAVGLFLVPNVRKEIAERFDIHFSRWVVVIIAVVGIGLGGAFMPTSFTNTPQTDTQPSQNNTNNADQLSKAERTHSIGESFTVGDIQYQVSDVSTRSRLGSSMVGVEADGQFFIVSLSVTNNADESVRMRASSLKLMIGDSTYSRDSEAFAYLDNSFTFQQLSPGVETEGQIAYDVPSGASLSSSQLKVNPVGLFSTEEPHYVNLGG